MCAHAIHPTRCSNSNLRHGLHLCLNKESDCACKLSNPVGVLCQALCVHFHDDVILSNIIMWALHMHSNSSGIVLAEYGDFPIPQGMTGSIFQSSIMMSCYPKKVVSQCVTFSHFETLPEVMEGESFGIGMIMV